MSATVSDNVYAIMATFSFFCSASFFVMAGMFVYFNHRGLGFEGRKDPRPYDEATSIAPIVRVRLDCCTTASHVPCALRPCLSADSRLHRFVTCDAFSSAAVNAESRGPAPCPRAPRIHLHRQSHRLLHGQGGAVLLPHQH